MLTDASKKIRDVVQVATDVDQSRLRVLLALDQLEELWTDRTIGDEARECLRVEDGEHVVSLSIPGNTAFAVKISPNGRTLLTANTADNSATMWSLATRRPVNHFGPGKARVFGVAICPSRNLLAYCCGHEKEANGWGVFLVDLLKGRTVAMYLDDLPIWDVDFSRDGRFLSACTTTPGSVFVIDLETNEITYRGAHPCKSPVFLPDNRLVVSDADFTLSIIDLPPP